MAAMDLDFFSKTLVGYLVNDQFKTDITDMPDFDLRNNLKGIIKIKEEGEFKIESKTLINVSKLDKTNLVLELAKSKNLLTPFAATQSLEISMNKFISSKKVWNWVG